MTIFAGCRRNEGCWELPELGLSLFSHALTRSLTSKSDRNGDGRLQFSELSDCVRVDVEQLTRRKSLQEQHPTLWAEAEESLMLPISHQP